MKGTISFDMIIFFLHNFSDGQMLGVIFIQYFVFYVQKMQVHVI